MELLHQRNEGVSLPARAMTVAAYLDRWMADYVRTSLAPKTVQTYREIIDNRLAPAFGAVKLTALKPHAIQAWYTGLLRDGRADGEPLSAKSVLRYHQMLHAALHHAVRWQLLIRNPADAVEPPRARRRELLRHSSTTSTRFWQPRMPMASGRSCGPPSTPVYGVASCSASGGVPLTLMVRRHTSSRWRSDSPGRV